MGEKEEEEEEEEEEEDEVLGASLMNGCGEARPSEEAEESLSGAVFSEGGTEREG